MASPVIAPTSPTYVSRTPYLTSAEYLAAPTGVDVSQLVVNGTTQQNAEALKQTVAMASSAVDGICLQVIAATLDTQADIYRVQRGGVLKIPLDNTPIVQVNDVKVGLVPGSLVSLADLSQVWIGKKVIEVPVYGVNFPPTSYAMGRGGGMYAVTSYVSGYANCLLIAPVAIGATTFTVDSPLGILPGMTVSICDPSNSEQVNVLSVMGNVVTLNTPFQFNHAVGVAVSTLPPKVKEAAILLTTVLIKTRGDDSFVMPSLGSEPSQMTKLDAGSGGPEMSLAMKLLAPHRRSA
jgi:hypothetical protein